MRYALTLVLLGLIPLTSFGQISRKKRRLKPIKVVELKRKDPVIYEKEIEPIFYKKCITCHSGPVKEGRFDISSYEALMKGGKRGKAVVPAKGAKSLLYLVAGRMKKPYMPPKGETPLSPEELALVKLWIDQGAKAPTGPSTIKKTVALVAPPENVTPVRAVTVSSDKSMIVAGRGNKIHVFDAGSGKHIRTMVDPELKTKDKQPMNAAHLSLVESMALSPDGKYLVSGSFQEVSIWDPMTGMLRHRIKGFDHLVVCIRFSPDGKKMVCTGGAPTADGEVKVFEVGTWKLLTDIKNGHSDTVYGACFSPDGNKIATASADKFVKVFELPSGKFIKSLEGHTHHVLDVGWQADGKKLASAGADNTVKIWDYEKGEQIRTVNGHNKQVTRLEFIGKSTNFATCSGDTRVRFTSANNGRTVRNFSGHKDFVYALSVSPDGQLVAAGGEEGLVRVYNGQNGSLIKTLLPPGAQTEAATN